MIDSKLSDFGLFKFFWTYLKPYKKMMLGAVLAIPLSVGATLLVPWLIVVIIDQNLANKDYQGLYLSLGLMSAGILVGYLADAYYSFTLQKTGQYAISDLRRELFDHCLRLPRSFYDNHPIGTVLSRLTSDMESLGESLAMGVLNLISDIFKTIGLFFFLLFLSWQLTLLMLFILIPVYGVTSLLKKKLRQTYNETRESLAESTSFLSECLHGIKTLQLYAAEEKTLKHFAQKNRRFLVAQNQSNIYDALLYSVIEGLTSIALACLIWYGSGQILAGIVTIGVLIGFINTLGKIFIPIREFAQQLATIQRAFSALEHIMGLFNEPLEVEESLPLATLDKLRSFESLEFKKVWFSYQAQSEPVLKDINFRLTKGQRLALVGATGSGKSTILRLLFRAYDGYQGSILLNTVELRTIPRKTLLGLIGLMQQDVYLFNESLKFNITLGEELSETEIQAAAQSVSAHPFIESLPGAYEFKVTDNGKNLSAGQAQLISFARTMAKGSDLVLLDEATSSVDSITEKAILEATTQIFNTKTVIAIAHRLSTIEHSDLILVMRSGQIIEQGTHQELVAQGGYYEHLLNALGEQQSLQQSEATTADLAGADQPLG